MVFMRIALRNLARNKRRTLMTLAAMVFGLTVLALVRGYANAIRKVQVDATVYGTTGMLQVRKKGYQKNVLANPLSLSFVDDAALRAKIMSVEGVKALAPRLIVSGLFTLAEQPDVTLTPSTFLNAIALDPDAEKVVSPDIFGWVLQGQMLSSNFEGGVVLNQEVATSLQAKIVEPASAAAQPPDTQTWPVLIANDVDGNMNGVALLPIGTLSSVLPGDKRYAFVHIKSAQSLLRMENKVTSYAITLNQLDQAEPAQKALEQVLGEGFEVYRWDELAPFIKDIVRNIELVFLLVTLIFSLVILLGIVNSLLMTVLERKREIGTLMALGGTRKQVATLFTLEGFFLGALGGLCGTLLGMVAVNITHHVGIQLTAPGSSVKIIIRPFVGYSYFLVSFATTVVLSALVSLWPAVRASLLKPVEALQSL